MIEQWICANPRCKFVLVMGASIQGIPAKCPCCGGGAWDVISDSTVCRRTGGPHVWAKGTDREGQPHIDPDQVCRACGAIPFVEGVTN